MCMFYCKLSTEMNENYNIDNCFHIVLKETKDNNCVIFFIVAKRIIKYSITTITFTTVLVL